MILHVNNFTDEIQRSGLFGDLKKELEGDDNAVDMLERLEAYINLAIIEVDEYSQIVEEKDREIYDLEDEVTNAVVERDDAYSTISELEEKVEELEAELEELKNE